MDSWGGGVGQLWGEPAVLPDAFIHELRQRIAQIEQAGGLHLDGLKHGDQVKIVKDPFAGYEAVFDVHLPAEERAQVFLDWLGREVKVKVNINLIAKKL